MTYWNIYVNKWEFSFSFYFLVLLCLNIFIYLHLAVAFNLWILPMACIIYISWFKTYLSIFVNFLDIFLELFLYIWNMQIHWKTFTGILLRQQIYLCFIQSWSNYIENYKENTNYPTKNNINCILELGIDFVNLNCCYFIKFWFKPLSLHKEYSVRKHHAWN